MKYLIIPLILLFGCTKTHIALKYQPVIEQREKVAVCIDMPLFKDERMKQGQIGTVRNLLGLPIRTLVTDVDVPALITEAFHQELERSGYTLSCKGADYRVKGEISQFRVLTHLRYHTYVRLHLTVKRGKKVIFAKTYVAESKKASNWSPSDKTCARLLRHDLQEIIGEFIRDFSTLSA